MQSSSEDVISIAGAGSVDSGSFHLKRQRSSAFSMKIKNEIRSDDLLRDLPRASHAMSAGLGAVRAALSSANTSAADIDLFLLVADEAQVEKTGLLELFRNNLNLKVGCHLLTLASAAINYLDGIVRTCEIMRSGAAERAVIVSIVEQTTDDSSYERGHTSFDGRFRSCAIVLEKGTSASYLYIQGWESQSENFWCGTLRNSFELHTLQSGGGLGLHADGIQSEKALVYDRGSEGAVFDLATQPLYRLLYRHRIDAANVAVVPQKISQLARYFVADENKSLRLFETAGFDKILPTHLDPTSSMDLGQGRAQKYTVVLGLENDRYATALLIKSGAFISY